MSTEPTPLPQFRGEAEERAFSDTCSGKASYREGTEYYSRKQYARAFAAFDKAAAAAYPPALRRLGLMYLHGIAVQKDMDRAVELLEKAVALGDVYAKGYLGQFLIHGSSGYLLGGISRPRQVLRGLRIILSGFCDALFSRKSSAC